MTLAEPATTRRVPDPMLPVAHRVVGRRRENADTVTLSLRPVAEPLPEFRPGQFTMLLRPGIGEIPISISGRPRPDGMLVQTIRAVGPVSRALCGAPVGTMIGARGPFGTHWDLSGAYGGDVVVVGGGCGLAPLRPIVLAVLAERARFGRVVGVLGARDPAEFIFAAEISLWTARSDLELLCTVDRGDPDWSGRVGLVTEPMATVELAPERTTAFLCGPEIMIRNTAELLLRRGVPADRIQVSVERNMQCGVGLCGHCQLGPLLTCRDGPVLSYAVAAPLLAIREL